MLFPTIEFAIFFIVVFIFSWTLIDYPVSRKIFLTLASYFFYGFWDWRFTFLLFGCTLVNYLFALAIGLANERYSRKNGLTESVRSPFSGVFIASAVICDLGVLAFFKYYFFLTSNLNNLFTLFHFPAHIPVLTILLPIGISFFTFQALSYVIDVYRQEYPPYRSLLDLMLYKAFFPQLIAGPIVRAKDFLPQLKTQPRFEDIPIGRAVTLISFGLFKKIFIANYLSTLFVDSVFANPTEFSSIEALASVYGYAVQIFCDFSAYSDIAIGTALLLGYTFPENFNNPYRARSIQDFWRRWHISLSSWLRDYLYIPLGGNRKGSLGTYRNLLITMLLGGLWHGAAWNFIIWGLWHGVGLALERFAAGIRIFRSKNVIWRAAGIVFTFHFVCFGWIFFRAATFQTAVDLIKTIFRFSFSLRTLSPFILFLIGVGLLIHFIPGRISKGTDSIADRIPVPILGLMFAVFLVFMSAVSPEGMAPFIYFQF